MTTVLVVDDAEPSIPPDSGLDVWVETKANALASLAKQGHFDRVIIRDDGDTQLLVQKFQDNSQNTELVRNTLDAIRRISRAQ